MEEEGAPNGYVWMSKATTGLHPEKGSIQEQEERWLASRKGIRELSEEERERARQRMKAIRTGVLSTKEGNLPRRSAPNSPDPCSDMGRNI